MAMSSYLDGWLRILYVVFAFCSAFFLGALKAVLVGPVAASILIGGNVGLILLMFPPHVAWTVYTLVKTNRFDALLKAALLVVLPVLFAIWLGLSMLPVFLWEFCMVSLLLGFPLLRPLDITLNPRKFSTVLWLIHVPGFIVAGLMGLIVDVPLFTAIVIIKSPYMLFKGWFRLIHDLISREGPFLETACIPIAGLTILLWPLIVVGSILITIFSSIFVGLYASVIVYQERSFRRGIAYVIAMVAEFDEYTNDGLYLREGSCLPKITLVTARPRYRKKKASNSSEISVGGHRGKFGLVTAEASASAMLSQDWLLQDQLGRQYKK
ncbi:hypothetical protein GH714_032152 [Hevea brasiliensis]|uniref:Uncharacterized protein n=1 Tax=Hevea brasiliensis TaxID=3981 RepID=A0A6A6L1N3_HEVBR|nr:hypothetical protein GH714_032152 [Hevea brasiliensis]